MEAVFVKLLAPYWEPEKVQKELNDSCFDAKSQIYITSVIQQRVEEWFRSDVDSLGETLANMPWFNSSEEGRDIYVHNHEGLLKLENSVKNHIMSDVTNFVQQLMLGEKFRDLTVTQVVTEILEFMSSDIMTMVTPSPSTETIVSVNNDQPPVERTPTPDSVSSSGASDKISPKTGKSADQMVKKVKSDLKKFKTETKDDISALKERIEAFEDDATNAFGELRKVPKMGQTLEDIEIILEWQAFKG